jgi:lipopolysaccharide/colanic/teichoic acid biosynthesis glycosyltransferase
MMRPVDRLWFGRKMLLLAGDICVFGLVLATVSYLRDPDWLSAGLVLPLVPVFGFCALTAYAAGLYELRVVREFVALVGGLLGSCVASWMLGTTYFYLASAHFRFLPKVTLLFCVLGAHVGMFAWRRAVLVTSSFNTHNQKIVVLADRVYQKFLRDEFNVVHAVETGVNLVVVDRRWSSRHVHGARQILASAIAAQIPVVKLDDFLESFMGRVSPEHANDLAWALDHVLPRSGSSVYFKAKRALDVLVALAFVALVIPIMVLVSALIALIDRTSPFYAQDRVGYLGREFRLWKFRTMRPDAEQEGPFTKFSPHQDPRVTWFGGVLRRWHIDELPQLWNVLRGDMSLVGPRPEWAREVEILEAAVPTYTLRYLVPPGMTGWAQVYYRATNNLQDSIEKHHYDLYYLKHFSLALDLSILLKTVKRAFVHDAQVLSALPPATSDAAIPRGAAFDIGSIVARR